MPNYALYLFGLPQILRAAQPVHISLRKSVALLVYLAATRQTFSRKTLASVFWRDDEPGKALANLRRAIYRVNSTLDGEILSTTRKSVCLNPEIDLWVDTTAFQEYVTACPPGSIVEGEDCELRLSEALELYRDDFLSGFSLPDSPAFDEWQFFFGESLRSDCRKALERLVRFAAGTGAWEQAIAYARRLVAMDPLDEAAHRLLMELYSRSGKPSAALSQYKECCRVLQHELGIKPASETSALVESIKLSREGMAATVSPGSGVAAKRRVERASYPGPPHNLPVHPTPFVGRQRELQEVQNLLVADPDCRLLTIIGPGGIGKTHLALESAHAVLRSFKDGVYFVPLASLSSGDPILATLAEQIGLGFYDGSTARQQLLHFLRHKQMLLVLDNLEHLLQGAGVIAEILENAAGVKILATSQERLNLVGETIFSLDQMSYPESDPCEDPLAYDAVRLFVQNARLARPQAALQEADLGEIVRICRLVQGMPLALILAAGWSEILSFKEIADEITSGLDFLESQMRDLPERQRSVRATFDYSWKRLSPLEQRAFMRLSIFPQGFTRRAAHQVSGASLQILRHLLEKSLLSMRSDGRYEIHELLRKFTAQQLRTTGELFQIRQAHSDYFLAELAQAAAHLKGGRQFETLDEIDADLENIRLAWNWALAHEDVAALDGAIESLYLFFTFRCRYQEGAEFFYAAWQQIGDLPGRSASLFSARLLSRSSWLRSLAHDFHPHLQADIETALALARQHGDPAETAFGLLLLGCYNLYALNDASTALRFLEQSYAQYRSLDDQFYMAITLLWLGTCHAESTHQDHLIYFTQQSLELARQNGNKATIPYNLRNLSLGALCTGAYDAAETYSREALQLNTEMGMLMGITEAKNHLGLVYFLRGELELARRLVEEGLAAGQEVGFAPAIANGLAVLGLLSTIQGENQAARHLFRECLDSQPCALGVVLAHWGLGIVHCNLGEFDRAGQHFKLAWDHAWQRSYRAAGAWLLPGIAMILAWQGNGESAAESLCLAWKHHLNPSGWLERWDKVQALQTRLKQQLGEQAYETACRRSGTLDLHCLVSEFFGERKRSVRKKLLAADPCRV